MDVQDKSMKMRGAWSIFVCAAIWGLFWIPMRHFDAAGINNMWGVAAIHLPALLIALPLAIYFRDFGKASMSTTLITGFGLGLSNVFYFSGLILSDVIRVTFLFYLLPIWATLFSRLIFGVLLDKTRMFAVGLAFTGLWLLLGSGSWPLPQNLGDVFGLLAGMAWAFSLTMLRGRETVGSLATTALNHLFACVFAILIGIILMVASPDIQQSFPTSDVLVEQAPYLVAFGILILWTSTLGQVWGAALIAATTAALLTMSEIVVATLSATFIGGESLSTIAWIGASLIFLGVLVDLKGSDNG